MTFLDLFAGIGGFRWGLEQSGHTCVGHVEIDVHAHRSYMAMYGLCPCPEKTEGDKNISWLYHKEGENNGEKEENCNRLPAEWYAKDIKRLTAGQIPSAEIWKIGRAHV